MARTTFLSFFSVVLVLRAVLPSVSALCIWWQCDKPSVRQLNIPQPWRDDQIIHGTLIVYRKSVAGDLTAVGCIDQDGRRAYLSSPSCQQESTHAVYNTPLSQGVVLLAQMKPPTFCGLLYDIFECCPDLAKQGDAGAGQIPILNRHFSELRRPITITFKTAQSYYRYWQIRGSTLDATASIGPHRGNSDRSSKVFVIIWHPAR